MDDPTWQPIAEQDVAPTIAQIPRETGGVAAAAGREDMGREGRR